MWAALAAALALAAATAAAARWRKRDKARRGEASLYLSHFLLSFMNESSWRRPEAGGDNATLRTTGGVGEEEVCLVYLVADVPN